jgi:hypothetical protein
LLCDGEPWFGLAAVPMMSLWFPMVLVVCDPEFLAASSFWPFPFADVVAEVVVLAWLFLGALCARTEAESPSTIRKCFETVVMRAA